MLFWIIAIVGAVAGFIALLMLIAMTRPSTFRYVRQATMNAPPAEVFAQINDFHKWQAWSPWGKLDLQMRTTYTGSASGVGASYSWSGNKKVGQGRMTIVASTEPSSVSVEINFLAPFKVTNMATFAIVPSATGSQVTWAMTGKSPLMMRVMGLFMNMDKLIGNDFESGLAALTRVVEKKAG